MKGQNVPDDHHVLRLASFSRLLLDDEQNPIGFLYTAFQRKETEDGLSVTWLEYFSGDEPQQIEAAVLAIRASNMSVGKKSAFAIGNVGAIKSECLAHKHKVRIIHWPEDDNKAHAELRRYPTEDIELFGRLATLIWSRMVRNCDVPDGKKAAPETQAV